VEESVRALNTFYRMDINAGIRKTFHKYISDQAMFAYMKY